MAASTAAISIPTFKLHETKLRFGNPSNPIRLRLHCPTLTLSSSHHRRRFNASPEIAAVAAVEEEEKEEQISETPEDGGVNTKLYFGNLPYSVDSATLAGLIQDFANPELVEVLYNRETGRSRGFAFVTMSSVDDCNAVVENLDGSEYMGRTLRVNFSDKPKPKEPLYPETEYKLFVGNLSWSVTSESLAQAFQGHGNVVGARVLYDGETGKSRGYGFVCYSSQAEMEAALQSLNGVELEGREMRVSLAQGKKY
ncbi:PREDICTED: 28 kDa ribonucleoprotein, chloroplastic [Tarenaya hassleriana]|uniref:28 kDa ribonucleoprotein, chloroplastic n=1 Tax=Tarenaya hassleriana TaxID=28532 RepID=UPI00053C7D72|nr:PREDICTED: 28 kDa ribonucleoprotein, chloroplastic [Tarenaya hassleriana]